MVKSLYETKKRQIQEPLTNFSESFEGFGHFISQDWRYKMGRLAGLWQAEHTRWGCMTTVTIADAVTTADTATTADV